jgi:FdhD protein
METKGLKKVEVLRIATDDPEKPPVEESCQVAVEEPLAIDVQGLDKYTVLCTPDDKRAMTVGFMFSEGIINGVADIAVLGECEDDPGTMRVRLADTAPRTDGGRRNLLIVSSCGACGSESMEDKLAGMPEVGEKFRLERGILLKVNAKMRAYQAMFAKSGGTHAIGLFDSKGEIVSFAEDIGRHNALDKAIGKCILTGRDPSELGAALSGRVSLEMVGKCARAGIEVISAVSAPTSLALEAALRCGITVLAFVRDTRATVFTCPHRVLAREKAGCNRKRDA